MQVFLTGASGFIAKHILLTLLSRGHRITASLRDPSRRDEVTAALRPHLPDPALLDALNFVRLDLTSDDGWAAALEGSEALFHTASPFPLTQPKNPDDVIRPAVEGTRRALSAAHRAGVKRVILTSSIAAIGAGEMRPGRTSFDEEDWSRLDHPTAVPYTRSKTLAERAAWEIAESKGLALTAINPGFVLGPPLDGRFGTSVRVLQRMMSGKDPMLPRLGFAVVDVRDVAEAHVRALKRLETAGRRYIAASDFLWFTEIAEAVRQVFPDRRIPRRVAPDLLLRLLALGDPSLRTILPSLGRRDAMDNARARSELGMTFRPGAEAVQATARVLVRLGAVP